jgi:hypothetical protein
VLTDDREWCSLRTVTSTTDHVIVSAAVPPAVDKILSDYCAANDRSKSWLIRSLLISWANAQRKTKTK